MFATKMKTAAALLVPALMVSQSAMADWALNMPVGVTETSQAVHGLHMIILWVCVVIGIVVFGAMFYSIYAHRKSKGATAATFHESTTMEILWTAVPFAILIAMAIPSTKVLSDMYDGSEEDMTVKVTGFQWKWRYDYVGENVGFYSTLAADSNIARQKGSGIDPNTVDNYLLDVDKPLVIPADTKVKFLLTANDVIHSWWVPDLGWKKDAIPGFINEAWTKVPASALNGEDSITLRGVCAELCGRDHGFMPIVVEVKSKDAYAKWLAEQKAASKLALNQ